jgi:hypothetical protein
MLKHWWGEQQTRSWLSDAIKISLFLAYNKMVVKEFKKETEG